MPNLRKPTHPCACGCGREAGISVRTGEPNRFAFGHQHRVYRPQGPNYHAPAWFERRRA